MSRLFKKTLIVVVVLFGLISTSISILSAWSIYTGMTQEFDVKGHSIGSILAEASIAALMADNPAALQSTIDEYLGVEGVSHVLIADRAGDIVAHTFVPGIPNDIAQLTHNLKLDLVNHRAGTFDNDIHEMERHQNIVSPILGGEAGYVLVGMDKSLIKDQILSIILQQQGIVLLLMILSIIITYFLIDKISQPLTVLNRHAEKLASVDIENIDCFKHEIARLTSHSHDEIGELAKSFIFMEDALAESVKTLASNVAAQERINTELAVAREIQLKMLPDQATLKKLHKNVIVYAMVRSAKEVGGDLFDCFYLGEHGADSKTGEFGRKLFFVIGDVAGKGVPAALFMSMTCTLLRTKANNYSQPGDLLQSVNRELCVNNDACMFVTVFCGVLDLQTGKLVYCSAGHDSPFVLSPADGVTNLECKPGIALGVLDKAVYENGNHQLSSSDTLFLYTDGVTEAKDMEGQLYSVPRLVELLNGQLKANPETILKAVIEDIDRFADEAPQADDITMMAIHTRLDDKC
ncbi:MAG: SpoIIE family protein phosphatase [Gammaproteobacteria bacterium]|nr:SpoIIE family protein phosphatase [Gammaproteobacteria bacterium]